ncbi:hypothetical protein [Vibrio owensii]|uniref:hypothetical protein n=1 Tax=Vibrio owensii TaxID=696485 RepID=UPI003CC57008
MKILKLLEKYSLTDGDLDKIALAVMEGKGLIETTLSLKKPISPEKVFVVAKEFCRSEYGLEIDDFSPQFALDRLELQQSKCELEESELVAKSQAKKFKNINEDLTFLLVEIQTKAA